MVSWLHTAISDAASLTPTHRCKCVPDAFSRKEPAALAQTRIPSAFFSSHARFQLYGSLVVLLRTWRPSCNLSAR